MTTLGFLSEIKQKTFCAGKLGLIKKLLQFDFERNSLVFIPWSVFAVSFGAGFVQIPFVPS